MAIFVKISDWIKDRFGIIDDVKDVKDVLQSLKAKVEQKVGVARGVLAGEMDARGLQKAYRVLADMDGDLAEMAGQVGKLQKLVESKSKQFSGMPMGDISTMVRKIDAAMTEVDDLQADIDRAMQEQNIKPDTSSWLRRLAMIVGTVAFTAGVGYVAYDYLKGLQVSAEGASTVNNGVVDPLTINARRVANLMEAGSARVSTYIGKADPRSVENLQREVETLSTAMKTGQFFVSRSSQPYQMIPLSQLATAPDERQGVIPFSDALTEKLYTVSRAYWRAWSRLADKLASARRSLDSAVERGDFGPDGSQRGHLEQAMSSISALESQMGRATDEPQNWQDVAQMLIGR